MASLIEELIDTLNKENSEYEKLLELSKRKATVIVSRDIAALEKITDEYGTRSAKAPELPTEPHRTDVRASAPLPEAEPVYPSAAEEEGEEKEELSTSGPSQLRDLELQIQRLAEEINALESGR